MSIKRNGVLAFSLGLIVLVVSGGFFAWMYYSSMHNSTYCPDGFSLTSEDPRCRAPLIADYSFLVSIALSVLILCFGISQRRNQANQVKNASLREADENT